MNHRVSTKRGEARVEKYTKSTEEPFGLNKRARRIRRGDTDVTRPNGKQDQK